MGALLALASSLTWGVADFMGGLAARRAGPVHVLAVSYPAGALVVTCFALFLIPGEISTGVLIWGTLAGFIGALGIGLLYLALVHGPMGIVSPTCSLVRYRSSWGCCAGSRSRPWPFSESFVPGSPWCW